MRAVFINHCHPDTPHICATRVREFAIALADHGHEIILLTETLDGGPIKSVRDVARELDTHDFSHPYNLACPTKGHGFISLLRRGKLPWGLRQLVIVYYYAFHHGVVTNWRTGCQPYLECVVENFKPNVIWASFGNSDCWNIARDLAAKAKCPWVADIKDPWRIFIPSLFQNALSRLYSDADAMTCFSQMHEKEADSWFKADKTVLYSGFKKSALGEAPLASPDELQILLTGAIYDDQTLRQMINGVGTWLDGQAEAEKKNVKFIYAGNDGEQVDKATSQLRSHCQVEILGYQPIERLQELQRNSLVNIYVKSDRTFHHKLIELLSARRPVLSFPAEISEAKAIAESVNIPLYSCSRPDEISLALDSCRKDSILDGPNNSALAALSWESQAMTLETVLQNAIEENKTDPS